MPLALTVLVGCTFLGGWLAQSLHLPLPGPVVGMFLLALALLLRQARQRRNGADDEATIPQPLARLADGLIGIMGLMFVPAGVGVISELGLIRQQWWPIVAGLVGSTLLSLLVTAWAMHHLLRRQGRRSGNHGESA